MSANKLSSALRNNDCIHLQSQYHILLNDENIHIVDTSLRKSHINVKRLLHTFPFEKELGKE